ncbi:hypothetical protein D1BOALGB6SA_3887 [Olavius sp. associated proteobacterium Delta 1]|nr:hypothetical protein D1BOALGB6SA_3887 [Olavius sp. associated proteobacterium Delta 1]
MLMISALILAIYNSAKQIAYTRFHPETGYLKYPVNPVNPVKKNIYIESIPL